MSENRSLSNFIKLIITKYFLKFTEGENVNDVFITGLIKYNIGIFSFSWKRQICEITKQISENKKLRISLSSKQIEKLAGIINEKNDLEQKTKVRIIQEKEQLKHSIADISHDLRTPLTSIQGYLTLLKDCEDKEEQEHYFSIIQAKADYLTELLQIFYDLSLIDSEDYILEVEKLDINRIVTDCLIDKYSELKN